MGVALLVAFFKIRDMNASKEGYLRQIGDEN